MTREGHPLTVPFAEVRAAAVDFLRVELERAKDDEARSLARTEITASALKQAQIAHDQAEGHYRRDVAGTAARQRLLAVAMEGKL